MKKYLFLVLCAFYVSFSYAQQGFQVSGEVVDSSGAPIEGVTVKESAKNGTLTSEDGTFTLTVKKKGTELTFSFIGYKTEKIPADAHLKVILHASQQSDLSDVVVIGTQVQSKRTTTAALSTVSGDEIENLPSPSVDALLQGRVAGLNV